MQPFNLLKADLRRIVRDVPLRVMAVLTLVVNLFTIGSYKLLVVLSEQFPAEDMEGAFEAMGIQSLAGSAFFSCLSISNIGILICIAVAMFIGKDFVYNTVRNKVCAASRVKVYLSSLGAALVIGLGLHVLSILESAALAAILFGDATPIADAVNACLISLPLYAGFIAVMVFISMTLKSQVLGMVINIVVVVFVPSILSIVAMTGVEALEKAIGLIPYAVVNELSMGAVSTAIAIKGVVGGLLLGIAATVLGCVLFTRADLK
ncbi:MAG: hypothetical protein HFK10_04405 [Clostridia bacterium]|nr:hypothetical protein [Clostridia bacterium]